MTIKKIQACSLGLAALALTAMPMQSALAQSNVEIYGLVGVYAGSIKRSDMTPRVTQLGHGGLTTSYFGFRGREDLGGGLKAIFQIENFFQPDTGAAGRNATDPSFASRSAWVGIQGGFGQLTLGRHTTPFYLAMQAVNPFVASTVFSPVVLQSYIAPFGGTIIGDTVWNNAIQYSIPTMNGFSATAIYGLGEVAGSNGVGNLGLTARYAQGPFLATASAQRVRVGATAPSTGQYAYLGGVSYDFSFAKLFGSVQKTERTVTDLESSTYQLGASIPVSQAGKVLASWSQTKADVTPVRETTRNTAAIGYDYTLSKRTDLYAVYLRDKVTGNSAGNSYAVGIRHQF
ncbi:porin [Noviherbaspirillum saxi]|uniref:Porin n=1 Tax=Noviherbaspirillum saxi TaxID=2320863 RepID=A0A3A3FME6_9BURK|nr:porin [Noviherbaspirillum saxi]RJF92515.1 porin [Noviherbaspirillum saxi]